MLIKSSFFELKNFYNLAHQGDNLTAGIEIDCADIAEDGDTAAVLIRGVDGSSYPALSTFEDKVLRYFFTSADFKYPGNIYFQTAIYGSDGKVKHSKVAALHISKSIAGDDEPPEAFRAWLDEAVTVLDELKHSGGGTGAVTSVNGRTGDVSLTAVDVGALPADTPVVKDTDLDNILAKRDEEWHELFLTKDDFFVDNKYWRYRLVPSDGKRLEEVNFFLQIAREAEGSVQTSLIIGFHDTPSDSGFYGLAIGVPVTALTVTAGGEHRDIGSHDYLYQTASSTSASSTDTLPSPGATATSAAVRAMHIDTRPSDVWSINISAANFELSEAYVHIRYKEIDK